MCPLLQEAPCSEDSGPPPFPTPASTLSRKYCSSLGEGHQLTRGSRWVVLFLFPLKWNQNSTARGCTHTVSGKSTFANPRPAQASLPA